MLGSGICSLIRANHSRWLHGRGVLAEGEQTRRPRLTPRSPAGRIDFMSREKTEGNASAAHPARAVRPRAVKVVAGLVCPRRSLDCERLKTYFAANGSALVDSGELATDVVVVTCGFIERNIEESLALLRAMKASGARLIIAGCLPDIDASRLREFGDAPVVTTTTLDRINALFSEHTVPWANTPDANRLHDYGAVDRILGARPNYTECTFYDRWRVEFSVPTWVVRIADGCDARCSYCSHRQAIGPYRSKPLADCLIEVQAGYGRGYRVFKMTAMDSGRYGLDCGESLPQLLHRCLNEAGDLQFILEDINPVWLLKYREPLVSLARAGRLRGIQSPVQSASSRVLKLMRRCAAPERIAQVLAELKDAYPKLHLATEVIVGFPTEQEQDLDATLDMLRQARFDFLYLYPYYENERMESRNLGPKCSADEIAARVSRACSFFKAHKISYALFANTAPR